MPATRTSGTAARSSRAPCWWPSASTRRASGRFWVWAPRCRRPGPTGGTSSPRWRDFVAWLVDRGLHGVKLVVADAHAGLKEALDARLTGVPRQRCQLHLIENATAFVPRPGMRKAVVASLRAVFDAPDRPEAQR